MKIKLNIWLAICLLILSENIISQETGLNQPIKLKQDTVSYDTLITDFQIFEIDSTKIIQVGKTCFYNKTKIPNKNIQLLINKYPFPITKELMQKDYLKMKKHRNNRMFWTVSTIIFAVSVVPPCLAVYFTSKDSSSSWQMALPMAIPIAVSIGLIQLTNHKYKTKKKHIIATYNQFR